MPYRLVFGAQLRENAALRQSFFSLAEQIFGISFAEWHRGGYWQQSLSSLCLGGGGGGCRKCLGKRDGVFCALGSASARFSWAR